MVYLVLECPECGSKKIKVDPSKGEAVCMQCGLIVSEDEMIDSGKEWRSFDGDSTEKSARSGSPMKYVKLNKGLVTMIDRRGTDLRYRLIKWHKRASISSSMQRNLSIALTEMRRVASYLNIPETLVEAAALLYRKTVKKGLIRGRLIEAVVAAVLYTVCRTYHVPRTLNEMAEASGLTKKEIGRTYRFLVRELNLGVPLTNPIHYIPRFASELNLSGEVQEEGRKILEEAIKKGLISGRGPTGVAAAAVYIAGLLKGERRTQKEVANVAGVTEVTIRNRYRELKKRLNIDVAA
jgi:transcription initiation factor TFIIB